MQNDTKVRLDRWLWAARFYKTRSLAVNAIKRGRITVNHRKAKPARQITIGDVLNIRKAQLVYEVTTTALSEKRLSARLAQALYTELPASAAAREQRSQEIKANRQTLIDGRPSKKDRRLQQRLKRHLN
jgi:ribosome-associated heat shock protein Hsp15